jgi:hypothetical protein
LGRLFFKVVFYGFATAAGAILPIDLSISHKLLAMHVSNPTIANLKMKLTMRHLQDLHEP